MAKTIQVEFIELEPGDIICSIHDQNEWYVCREPIANGQELSKENAMYRLSLGNSDICNVHRSCDIFDHLDAKIGLYMKLAQTATYATMSAKFNKEEFNKTWKIASFGELQKLLVDYVRQKANELEYAIDVCIHSAKRGEFGEKRTNSAQFRRESGLFSTE